jgi:hypothetical protein
MRFAKEIASIAQGLLTIGYTEDGIVAVLERLAGDALPPSRKAVLGFLRGAGRSRTSAVADSTGLPATTATRTLEDLAALHVVRRHKTGATENAANEWELL